MRASLLAGIVLLGLGAFVLLRGASFTSRKDVLEVGDVKVTADQKPGPLGFPSRTEISSWKHIPPPRRVSARSAAKAAWRSAIGRAQNSTSPGKMSSTVR